MRDEDKSREELISELAVLRKKNKELEEAKKAEKAGNTVDSADFLRPEEAIKTESFYRTILEDLPILVCRSLPGGIITYVNDNYCRYFGKKREELIGKSFLPFIHKEDQGVTKRHFEGFSVENPIASTEKRVVLADGSLRWQKWTNRAIFDKKGRIREFQAIGTDITEQKQAEEERTRLQSQLIQSQKMEAVGMMAGGIAHDFNNIITVIKSLTELMIYKLSEGDPLLKFLKPIKESSDRAISLVQQLLLFSRKKSIEITDFNLSDAANDLLGILNHLISEDIRIETDFKYDLWKIRGDKSGIEQIITNLVINGSEAMLDGGKITIRTENAAITDEQSKGMAGARPGSFVCLTVEDTGAGMEKEIIERALEPFFTTKTTGSGMGLAVVSQIVKEHKGWINISSEFGEGTAFKVFLPAMPGTEEFESEAAPARNLIDGKGKGKRILLVEDEKWVRKSTAMILSENGYVVFEASNAENAISLFYREKGRFDLVLSDVVMPGRSGLQMISPLLDINPNIPILLCSGHLDDKAQLPQIIKRGLAYIQKPYEIPELLQAIEDTIAQG